MRLFHSRSRSRVLRLRRVGLSMAAPQSQNCFAALADSGDIVSRTVRRDEATYVADISFIGSDAFVVVGRHGEEHESVCGDVEVWTLSRPPFTVTASMAGTHRDIVRSVCQVGSGSMPYVRLATGSEDGRIAVWAVGEPQDGKCVNMAGRVAGRVSGGAAKSHKAKPY